ncbi:MAG: hypothetical protein ACLTBQ_08425 [Thomasclavelia sp.]|uniref:hypothetical protein n=1 Tax=Thomasclavelia sp. TaxID=3025757 RepID=UPI0039951365
MIVSMIRQFGLRLRADPEEIPFQHSANVQMQFIKDENYNDYTVVGYYIPPGESEAKLLNINDDGTFTLGPDCFKNRGTLSFSFNLVNSIEEVHLGSIDFDVRHAFGDSSAILPEPEEVWISVVTKVAEDAIKEDVELVKQKAKEASQSALTASEKANEALEYANNAKDASNSAITAKDDAIAASNSASQFSDTAEKSAIEAKNSADDALKNANASNKAIETVTQIKTEIENKANDFDANYQEKLKSFNDNATSKQNAFDNSVQTANTNFDNKVTQANSDLDAKVQEATKQAQKAKEEADRATQATDGKLDKNLGVENAGKSLVVGKNGEVVCGESGINEDEVNKIIDKAIDEKLYTQEEVDYLLDDKMDKPYYDIAITDDATIENTLAGNFKIDSIEGNIYQNTTLGNQLINEIKPGVLADNQGNVGSLTSVFKTIWLQLDIGSYTFGGNVKFRVVRICKDNGALENKTDIVDANKPYNIEITQKSYLGLSFRKEDNTAVNDSDLFMLNKGAELLPYEDYTGGEPSPNPDYPQEIYEVDEINVRLAGKNFIDINYISNIENWTNSNTDGYYYIPIAVPKNAQLVISNDVKVPAGRGYFANFSPYKEKNAENYYFIYHNVTGSALGKFASITKSNVVYLRLNSINVNLPSFVEDFKKMQLEIGSVATPYTPYQEISIQHTLSKPLRATEDGRVADTIDIIKSEVAYKMVDLLKEYITIHGVYKKRTNTITFIIYNSNILHPTKTGITDTHINCNMFKVKAYNNDFDEEYICLYSEHPSYLFLTIDKKRLDVSGDEDTNVLKQKCQDYIDTLDIKISYETSKPTTEPLEDELVQKLKTLKTFSPTTHVFVTGIAKPTLNAKYPKDIAAAQAQLEAKVITLQEAVIKNV